MSGIFSRRAMVFISGAGRGLGRCCALSAASLLCDQSLLVLCGRHLETLRETQLLVETKNPSLKVEIFALDLLHVDAELLSSTLRQILLSSSETHFLTFLIIHNAGSVGDVSKMSDEMNEEETVRAYFSENLVGTIVTNSVLLSQIREVDKEGGASILVVNISSLCAVNTYPSMSLYCTGKAAREMFFRCLSDEWRHSQSLWVINFSPGPMDTSMLKEVSENSGHESMKVEMQNLYSSGKVLNPSYSADKLFHEVISRYDHIKSGSRLDIFDL